MGPIKCKNCPKEITPIVDSGIWTDLDGFCYCKKQLDGEAPMLHEPIIPDEWRRSIIGLRRVWPIGLISRIMQLPVATIEEVLNDKHATS